MSELVRGAVADRPWGLTFGALGMRGLTGQLTLIADDGKQFCVAFEQGAIVGATSPMSADAVARVALLNHFATSHQLPEINRRLSAAPERDEIEVLAEMNAMTPDQTFRLRRRVVAQRAARTFAIDSGQFIVDDTVTIPMQREIAVDVRAIVFLGTKNLTEERLSDDLRPFGLHFMLRPNAVEDLPQFGFSMIEQPILDALVGGATLPELEARHRDVDPRALRSIIYALLSCNACEATAPVHGTSATATASAAPAPRASAQPSFALPDDDPEPAFSLPDAEPVPQLDSDGDLELELASPEPRTAPMPLPLVGRATRPIGGDSDGGIAINFRPTRTIPPASQTPVEDPARRTTTPGDLYTRASNAGDDLSLSRTSTTRPPAAARTATTTGQPPSAPRTATTTGQPPAAPRTTTTGQPPATPRTATTAGQPSVAAPRTATTSQQYPATSRTATPVSQSPPATSRTATPVSQPPPPAPRTATASAQPPLAAPRTATTTAPMPTRMPGPPTARTSTTGQPYARTLSAPATPRTITPQPQVAKGTDPSVVNAYDATEPLISARAATVPVSGPRPPTPSSPPPGSGPAGLGPAGSVQGPGQTPASGVRVTTPPSGVRSSTTATPPVGVRAITPSGGLPRTLTPSGGYGGNTNDHSSTRPAAESGPLPAVMDSGEFEQRASSADSAAAEDAFERGSSALRREDLAEAIEHLSRATTLNPQSIDYLAVLAWARFIATSDKASVADETRKTLLRAVAKSKSPEVAYFYLGRVERMLGNDRHALRYFREVVEIKPRHADAKAEIRILEQKVQAAAAREKSGLFGIKKR